MGKGWKKAGKLEASQKKGALFTKLAREIMVATKMGSPDPEANARLKIAINAALKASCPKDTIERAIKKGSGQLDDGSQIEEVTYEGYAPHGVGVIVECQTDNRNRTVAEIRNTFKSNGGNLGETGAVAWMFDRVAMIQGKRDLTSVDLEEEAIEAGANEVEREEEEENLVTFYAAPEDLDNVRTSLTQRGWEVTTAELSYKAKDEPPLTEEQKAEVYKLLEALEDNDDSHRVHATV